MSENDVYVPSWVRGSDDVGRTPPEERYGGGVGFEQDTTTPAPELSADSANAGDSGDGYEPPEWAKGDDLPDRDDFTPTAPVARCEECLTDDDLDLARAVYQLPAFDSEGVFFALLGKHGLQYLPDSDEWRAADGLSVDVDGRIEDRDRADVSYLTVRGPAGAVASFVGDLLDAVRRIKRELRAPSLVEVADIAEKRGERVDDEDRLVGRNRAAEVVDRLPRGDSK